MSKLKETVKICMQLTYVFKQGFYLLFYITAVRGNLFIPVSFINFLVNTRDIKRVSLQNVCQLKMENENLIENRKYLQKTWNLHHQKHLPTTRLWDASLFSKNEKKPFIIIFYVSIQTCLFKLKLIISFN